MAGGHSSSAASVIGSAFGPLQFMWLCVFAVILCYTTGRRLFVYSCWWPVISVSAFHQLQLSCFGRCLLFCLRVCLFEGAAPLIVCISSVSFPKAGWRGWVSFLCRLYKYITGLDPSPLYVWGRFFLGDTSLPASPPLSLSSEYCPCLSLIYVGIVGLITLLLSFVFFCYFLLWDFPWYREGHG